MLHPPSHQPRTDGAAKALVPAVHLATVRRSGGSDRSHYSVTLAYPVLSGSSVGILKANAIFASQATRVTDGFMAFTHHPLPDPSWTYTLTGHVQTGIVSSQLVSFTTGYYEYAGGAHGDNNVFSETVDLATGAPVGLGSLFKPGANWLAALVAQTRNYLLPYYGKFFGAGSIDYGTEPVASNFQGWSLSPFGLQVSFPEGQVGPEIAGSISVMIPLARFAGIPRPGGPMAIAAALNPVHMALLPATALPHVSECYALSAPNPYAVRATCAGGALNVAAWDQFINQPGGPVLSLGRNVPEARIKAALCPYKDYGLSTIATLAQLGISYYKWPYSALALSNLPKACP